jgi:hypothetical protein
MATATTSATCHACGSRQTFREPHRIDGRDRIVVVCTQCDRKALIDDNGSPIDLPKFTIPACRVPHCSAASNLESSRGLCGRHNQRWFAQRKGQDWHDWLKHEGNRQRQRGLIR